MNTPLSRCHCREACLSSIRPHDATITTSTGVVLAVHVNVPAYPTDGLTSFTSPLSKRVAS